MEEEIYTAVPFNNDFKLYNQCKYFIETVFNYDDIVSPPNFSSLEAVSFARASAKAVEIDFISSEILSTPREERNSFKSRSVPTTSANNALWSSSRWLRLLEQGSISNEQGAATVEQLTALLEYIKSLNIEGTNDYISKIEATLDSLNHRDEDQSALL